jgi:transcriptional regulator with XRE-family HTH domain
MMTLHQIKRLLRLMKLNEVSKGAGVHRNTLAEIRDNPDANPSHSTLCKLSEYFTKQMQ